uniref:Ubiquitin-like domain-containing protein n=1 Tax=Cryptomonas curvata TaxID=233186 RepID=A0A7S0MK31_9CRYP|mmetsp:Transcript_43848/g.91784  ORF Transcript_43848/g.91784 Transcript_43848/m.91784 type:complete len:112 (+) Transcript_43848:242-577(+)
MTQKQYTVKFLFADATTIEQTFQLDITVLGAKQQLISSWPAAKSPAPTPDELKMIYNGKFLENIKTFQDYKVPDGTLVNMHLQPTPSQKSASANTTAAKPISEEGRCCIVS